MAIRAVVSLVNPTVGATHANVTAAIAHTNLATTVTHTAAAMADLVLEYVPKNKRLNEVCALSEITVIASFKALADSLQTIDGQSKTVGKSPMEEIATSDTQHWEVEKHHDDPVDMLDTHAANFSKAATDQAALVDLPNWTVALAKSSDIAGLADQIDKMVNYSRVFYDAFGLDDSANINKDFVGNKGNIFGVSDLTAFTYQKPITDVVGHTDQHNIGTTLGKVDSLPTIDAAVIYSAKGVEDATGLADLNVWSLSKSTTDAISTSDLPSFVLSKPYFDDVATTDTFSREVEYARAPTETLSVSEITSKEFATTKAEALHSTDVFARTVSYSRNFYDAFGLDDYANINKDFVGSKGNIFGFSDTTAFSSTKYLEDQANFTDLPTLHTAKAKTDALATIDAPVLQVNKGRTDGVATTDTFSREVEYARTPSETVSIAEITSKELATTKTDALYSTDVFARTVNYNRPIDEYAAVTDTLGKGAQLGKYDSVGVNDVLARAVEFNRAVSEVISPADAAVTRFTKSTTDGATLADSITQTRIFNRSFADWFALDDFSSVDKNLAGTKTNVFGFADIHACEVEKEVADSFGFLESVTVTRRSTAGFNTASFNTALFN